MSCVLAIDQGTSATKAVVLAPDASIVAESSVPVHPRASAGGAVEQDPSELLDSVVAAGRAALAAAGEPVGGVGLGNQGETVLRWEPATGTPLGAALSWQDRRAVTVTERLAGREEELRQLTGLPLDPYFAAPKMTWLHERDEERAGGVVTTIDAWVLHALTGRFASDAATASRTGLLDLEAVSWSEAACAAYGLDPGEQPEIVDCAGPVGTTTAFGPELPVCGLAVDQQAALFAEGCLSAGEAKCTYGTGAFLLATAGREPLRSRAGLAACVAWRLGGETTYCLDGQSYTAGAAVAWLESVGLLAGAAELDAVAGEAGRDGGRASAAAEAPIFVPSLAGLGAPFWAPAARGGWVGLGLATSRGDLVRAVVEGLAAQVASLAAAMQADLGRPLERLRVDGGLARSDVLLQAQADLAQVRVERFPSPDATALGIGAFARLGAGLAASPTEAIGEWSPSAVFEPRMGADEATERLAGWTRAARAMVDLAAG